MSEGACRTDSSVSAVHKINQHWSATIAQGVGRQVKARDCILTRIVGITARAHQRQVAGTADDGIHDDGVAAGAAGEVVVVGAAGDNVGKAGARNGFGTAGAVDGDGVGAIVERIAARKCSKGQAGKGVDCPRGDVDDQIGGAAANSLMAMVLPVNWAPLKVAVLPL